MRIFFLLLSVIFLPPLLTAQNTSHLKKVTLPSCTIERGVDKKDFLYSNRNGAYFLGVLNGDNSSACHGILADRKKIFENYWITIGESLLDRSRSTVNVTPAGFVRSYDLGNTKEYVSFADSITLLSVSVRTDLREQVRIFPGWSTTWTNTVESYGAGMYTIRDDLLRASVAIQGLEGSWEVARTRDVQHILPHVPLHVPAVFIGSGDGPFHFTIEVAAATSHLQARPPQELFRISKQKQLDMTEFLAGRDFSCSDSVSEAAFNWIAASVHTHGTETDPWRTLSDFPDECALRTAYACLQTADALLFLGQFKQARHILHEGLQRIDQDSSSSAFGLLPVSDSTAACREITSKLYAAVDGYQRVSGDSSLAYEYSSSVPDGRPRISLASNLDVVADGNEYSPSASDIMMLIDQGMVDSAWTLTRAIAGGIMKNPFGLKQTSENERNSSPDVCGECVLPSVAATGNLEYLRMMHAGYAGVHRLTNEEGPAVSLDPRLPAAVSQLALNTRVGTSIVHVRYERASGNDLRCTVSMKSGEESVLFRPAGSISSGDVSFDPFRLQPGTSNSFILTH